MKKTYIKAAMQVCEVQANSMMAVSLIGGGNADPDEDVLSKEDSGWDIWGTEE